MVKNDIDIDYRVTLCKLALRISHKTTLSSVSFVRRCLLSLSSTNCRIDGPPMIVHSGDANKGFTSSFCFKKMVRIFLMRTYDKKTLTPSWFSLETDVMSVGCVLIPRPSSLWFEVEGPPEFELRRPPVAP